MVITFLSLLNKMHQSPELNAAGVATTCIALFNSFFSMLNPVLTGELVDNEGNQIQDPSKWCSNWFLPKQEEK